MQNGDTSKRARRYPVPGALVPLLLAPTPGKTPLVPTAPAPASSSPRTAPTAAAASKDDHSAMPVEKGTAKQNRRAPLPVYVPLTAPSPETGAFLSIAPVPTAVVEDNNKLSMAKGGGETGGDQLLPPVAACSGSSQDSEYISEDEHIHHLEKSGALNQVAGSQSILSQELHSLGETREVGGLQLSQDTMGGFSQTSVDTMGSAAATTTTDFDSQRLARKYGLLSQDPFALPARSLSEQLPRNRLLPPSDSQGSSQNSESNFGSLLDAVHMFQSQEAEEELKLKVQSSEDSNDDPEENNNIHDWQQRNNSNDEKEESTTSSPVRSRSSKRNSESPAAAKRIKKPTLPLSKKSGNHDDDNNKQQGARKSAQKNVAAKANHPKSDGAKKRKRKDDSEQVKQQQLAQRAAALAQRTINDADLAKRLLLSMALTRENPRSAPETLPGPGFSLPEGFFWAHYPPLEKVLKDNMAEYYELSVTKCQSAQQQSFNNTLVQLVRAESNRQGWLFASIFTDKSLRDRIRCYYKTHIQNAKKRLRTMVKNPTKRANARHLCAHLDMIESNVETAVEPNTACRMEDVAETAAVVIKHEDWGQEPAGAKAPAGQPWVPIAPATNPPAHAQDVPAASPIASNPSVAAARPDPFAAPTEAGGASPSPAALPSAARISATTTV